MQSLMKISFKIAVISIAWGAAIVALLKRFSQSVNPHHDGVILAPAIAVAEGRTPNLDVFSQYGFLVPYIQGAWLKLTSTNLYSLRLLTLIQVVITAFVLSLILRRKLGVVTSALISAAWMVSYPYILPFLPWPSVMSTFFLVSSIYALSKIGCDSRRNANYVLVSYTFLWLATLIRPQTALITLIVAVYFIKDSLKLPNEIIKKVLLLCTFPSVVIFFTFKVGLIEEYVSQSIVWASSHYGGLGFTIRGLAELLLVPIIGGLVLLGIFLTLKQPAGILAILYWLITAAGGLFLLKYFSWQYQEHPYFALRHPKVLLADLGINILNALGFAAFLGLLVGIYFKISLQIRTRKFFTDAESLIVMISGFTILQLYPASDSLHFWWVTPIFIVGAVYAFNRSNILKINTGVTQFALVLFIVISSLNFLHYQNPRNEHFRSEVLSGMSGPKFEVSYIDGTISIINSIPLESKVKYDCSDGLYAVSRGTYRGQDKNYVNWAPGYDKKSEDFEYIFQCNVPVLTPALANFQVWKKIPVRLGHLGVLNGFENRILIRDMTRGNK